MEEAVIKDPVPYPLQFCRGLFEHTSNGTLLNRTLGYTNKYVAYVCVYHESVSQREALVQRVALVHVLALFFSQKSVPEQSALL